MLASLGVVILYVGAFLEILDLSVACIASFIVMFCVVELGYAAALSVYGIISILSLMILPTKWVAIYFALFFGLMPITKTIYEKTGKLISWILKLVTFNAEMVLFYFIASALDFFEESEFLAFFLVVALVMLNIVFVLTDIAYTRLTRLYEYKYRNRIKKFLK